jgi:hypothetical protein
VAATLANMAWAAGEQGDRNRERELYLQAAAALASVRAWIDLLTVLGNLGADESLDTVRFLAQAFWLAARVETPIEETVSLAAALLKRVGPAAEAGSLIATTACFLAQTRGANHPKHEELQRHGFAMFAACAQERNVAPEKFQDWAVAQGLNDPNRFLPALSAALEQLVGLDGWLFDRALVG